MVDNNIQGRIHSPISGYKFVSVTYFGVSFWCLFYSGVSLTLFGASAILLVSQQLMFVSLFLISLSLQLILVYQWFISLLLVIHFGNSATHFDVSVIQICISVTLFGVCDSFLRLSDPLLHPIYPFSWHWLAASKALPPSFSNSFISHHLTEDWEGRAHTVCMCTNNPLCVHCHVLVHIAMCCCVISLHEVLNNKNNNEILSFISAYSAKVSNFFF